VVCAVSFQEPVKRAVLEESAKPGPSSYLPQDVKVAELTAKVAKPIKNSFFIIFQVSTNLSKDLNIRNNMSNFIT
jgi:hypothetical protein